MRSVGMNASENSIHDRKRIDRDQKKVWDLRETNNKERVREQVDTQCDGAREKETGVGKGVHKSVAHTQQTIGCKERVSIEMVVCIGISFKTGVSLLKSIYKQRRKDR